MNEDIMKIKKYRAAWRYGDMPTKIALQRLIDVLEEWRKNGLKTRRTNQ